LGLVGREPRADLDLQRALPSPATRGGGKTRTPLECGIRKERLLERGLGNPQGGWGGRGLHQAKHPTRGKYSAREGPPCRIYFRYRFGLSAGPGFRSKPLRRLAQSF
jgi:hypothetical protein